MISMTYGQALLTALGSPNVDPAFSRVWSALDKDMRRAVALVALDCCSTMVRNPSTIESGRTALVVPSGFELDSPVACAILDIIWVLDGERIVLLDINAAGPGADAQFLNHWRAELDGELTKLGNSAAVELKARLKKIAKEASHG